jgi:hypothetical protein
MFQIMNSNLAPNLFRAFLIGLCVLLQPIIARSQDFTIIAENQNLYSVDISDCEVNFLSAISPPSVSFADIT